jgi:predicted nucleic acid-binding protein
MDRAFADTGYWIALLSPRDELHSKAVSFTRQFESAEIVTSEMVLVEFLNAFSDHGWHLRSAASGLVISTRSSPRVRVISQAADLFGRALSRYQEMQDKSWSLTDCASFLIMRDEDLTSALTHDRHFEQAGFHALLR